MKNDRREKVRKKLTLGLQRGYPQGGGKGDRQFFQEGQRVLKRLLGVMQEHQASDDGKKKVEKESKLHRGPTEVSCETPRTTKRQ